MLGPDEVVELVAVGDAGRQLADDGEEPFEQQGVGLVVEGYAEPVTEEPEDGNDVVTQSLCLRCTA